MATKTGGVGIEFQSVTVHTAGHTVLQDIDLQIEPGSHVAVIGPSGAGKSTLVGLLLGWHRAAAGVVRVDGQPLTSRRLDALREVTAWVDPSVQLWNRSLLENLTYGTDGGAPDLPVARILEEAELHNMLERLPDGLQTMLGEGGGLVSGGEGQRVRLGRGLLRPGARLVILDEPFRGLDRPRRRKLLGRVRRAWRDATLLCITHDVSETVGFDRVLVLEGGRVVEDSRGQNLAANSDSTFRKLLDAEEKLRVDVWSNAAWRRMRLASGCLEDGSARGSEKSGGRAI